MRCLKCKYVFSEEMRICPRCKEDMGAVLEKIGSFPIIPKEPFLFPEDFLEAPPLLEENSKEKMKREIEINLSSDKNI